MPTKSQSRRKLKDLSILLWSLWIVFIGLPLTLGIKDLVQKQSLNSAPNISFVYFYGMGRVFADYPAKDAYSYSVQQKVCNEIHPLKSDTYGPIPYGPFIGLLFRQFARLSFQSAALVWIATSFLLYIAGVWLLSGAYFAGQPLARSAILCFSLSFWPFLHFLTSGQISMIGFFALSMSLLANRRERAFLAGLAVSLCLYKPTLLVLLLPMLIFTRRYRTLMGFVFGAFAQILIVTAIEGLDIWPGYLHLLLSFGSAAATRTQTGFAIHNTHYVDLVSFFTIFPGGHSPMGTVLLLACVATGVVALIRAWLGNGTSKNSSLLWASTLTWTLVLNTYVGIWDSVMAVPAVIATAGVLKASSDSRLSRQFTFLWISILAGSYVTTSIAAAVGFQLLTILLALLGLLQLRALRATASTETLTERPYSNLICEAAAI